MKTVQECIAHNLRAFREARGFTQLDVADRMDMAVRTYQKYEYAEAFPEAANLDKLAQVLKVTPSELIAQPEQTEAILSEPPVLTLDDAWKILKLLSEAGPFRRALVLALLYRDEKYLADLPHKVGRVAQPLVKKLS